MVAVAAARTRETTAPRLAALLGVLGVVYGDIGTSPLYAFKASLEHFTASGTTSFEVLGILSLIFWSLVLIVTVKYVLLVMRADNHGEGGILALMALAQRVAPSPRLKAALALVGIGGACLFFGDGVITPAISVLSAIEGLEFSAPGLQAYVLPISAVVIVALFAVQYRGTGTVGRMFGPVMAVWFAVIGLLGAHRGRARPARAAGAVAQLRASTAVRLQLARLRRPRLGGAGGDRGGGAVRRHGPFRRASRSGWPGSASCCPASC